MDSEGAVGAIGAIARRAGGGRMSRQTTVGAKAIMTEKDGLDGLECDYGGDGMEFHGLEQNLLRLLG